MGSSEQAPISVVITRDGQRAVALVEHQGSGRVQGGFGHGMAFRLRVDPRNADLTRVVVKLDEIFMHQLDQMAAEDQDHDELLFELAQAAIGDHLDGGADIRPVGTGQPSDVVSADAVAQSYFEKPGPRATDEEIQTYIAAKIYWGWRYGLAVVKLDGSDSRRLGVPVRDLARVAIAGDSIYWNRESVQSLELTATSKLLADFPTGAFPGSERPILERIADRLAAPRYESARAHFDRAHEFHQTTPADLPNAVKEAVAAVESLALKVLGLTSGTLGDCIKELRRRGLVPPPLDKPFEALWGYASEQPGVRHGKPTKANVPPAEALFMLNMAAAAILYLLELDK